jgi:hypothetical protein
VSASQKKRREHGEGARHTDVVDDDPAVAEAAVGAAEERLPVRRPRHGARRARVAHPVAVVGDGVAEAEEPREAAAAAEDRAGGDEDLHRDENARSRRRHGSSERQERRGVAHWLSARTVSLLRYCVCIYRTAKLQQPPGRSNPAGADSSGLRHHTNTGLPDAFMDYILPRW